MVTNDQRVLIPPEFVEHERFRSIPIGMQQINIDMEQNVQHVEMNPTRFADWSQ